MYRIKELWLTMDAYLTGLEQIRNFIGSISK
jgi:hypothetical protein